jgi:hypothetical protein
MGVIIIIHCHMNSSLTQNSDELDSYTERQMRNESWSMEWAFCLIEMQVRREVAGVFLALSSCSLHSFSTGCAV